MTDNIPEYYIDVRDDARIHVAALLDPSVNNERLFAFAYEFNWTDLIAILKKLRPDNKNIPNPPENEGRDLSDVKNQRAKEIMMKFFGVQGWTGLEDSVKAGIVGVN
jgi:hypothetical protein